MEITVILKLKVLEPDEFDHEDVESGFFKTFDGHPDFEFLGVHVLQGFAPKNSDDATLNS